MSVVLRKTCYLFICLVVFVMPGPYAQAALTAQPEIRLIAENLRPFAYIENDEPKGYMLELLLEIFDQAGMAKDKNAIEFLPWERAYRLLEMNANTSLFAMSMTEERQQKFHFVGPAIQSKIGLIVKRDANIQIESEDDLTQIASIGVVSNDVGEIQLLKVQEEWSNLSRFPKAETIINMLHNNRVTAISMSWLPFTMHSKGLGIDPKDYEMIFELSQSQAGFAFNKQTDQAVIAKLQAAFQALSNSGRVQELRSQYALD